LTVLRWIGARVDQDRVATARSNRCRLVANNALGQQQSLRRRCAAPATAVSERMLTDVNLTHPDELNSDYPACTAGM